LERSSATPQGDVPRTRAAQSAEPVQPPVALRTLRLAPFGVRCCVPLEDSAPPLGTWKMTLFLGFFGPGVVADRLAATHFSRGKGRQRPDIGHRGGKPPIGGSMFNALSIESDSSSATVSGSALCESARLQSRNPSDDPGRAHARPGRARPARRSAGRLHVGDRVASPGSPRTAATSYSDC